MRKKNFVSDVGTDVRLSQQLDFWDRLAEHLIMRSAIEAMARAVYRLAGQTGDRPIWSPKLAVRLLGDGALAYSPVPDADGMLVPLPGGKTQIFVRPNLTRERLAHVVGHELGHWICRREGVEDREDLCDAIGAAIVAPRAAYLAALSHHGARLHALAETFATTESLVALRYGEVTGAPTALITRESVRTCGEYPWPPENELRQLARSGGDRLRRLRLRDDPHRVVLTNCACVSVA